MKKWIGIVSGILLSAGALAQGYPSKPVKLVVPFPAGSATDLVARLSGQQLQDAFKQPFVVENKPGAQGAIAAEYVAKSAPDGYTLMVTTNTPQAANVSLFRKLPYDPVKDFEPVVRLSTTSFMLMARPDFPSKNLKELLAYVHSQPGKFSAGYGSAGSQVSIAMMKSMGKLDVVEVPYKGIPQTVTDVLGGTLSFTFVDLANALPQIKGGKLRGYAVTSEKRTPLAPDVPAMAEELKGYDLIAWFAIVAPAGTPKDIVQSLYDISAKALQKNEIREKYAAIGTDVAPMNPAQLGAFIKSEITKWAVLVKQAGIQPGSPMAGPLDGVRILDLTTVVMGPYATQILADFGADVIKVEPPEGDVMRHNAPMRSKGMGHIFMNANRNKRSVVLDLKKPGAREACLAIAKDADVLVYNIRPQAMARLKLGYDEVRAVNPRIIYVGAFGYSQRGPYAAKAAYDDLIQGATGLPWLLKEAGAEEPRYIPATLADRSVGLHIVNAVCAALYRREKSGAGQRVDVPMFESLLQTVMGEHMGGYTYVPQMGAPGYARMLAKERRPYATTDGYVCVLVYNDKQWRAFFDLIGRPELMADPRYATAEARSRDFEGANALVAAEMKKRSTAEWISALERADIPVQRMNSLSDIVEDPHLTAIGYFGEVEHPSEGTIRAMAVASEWSESAPEYRRHAPRLGEHTREVLREAGLQDSAIEQLIASGAAR